MSFDNRFVVRQSHTHTHAIARLPQFTVKIGLTYALQFIYKLSDHLRLLLRIVKKMLLGFNRIE